MQKPVNWFAKQISWLNSIRDEFLQKGVSETIILALIITIMQWWDVEVRGDSRKDKINFI